MSVIVSSFTEAAFAVRDTVARVPRDAWDGPGLGEWTVRDLVGHTSRSLVTVIEYLARPVDREVVHSAAAYYTAISAGTFDPAAVTERGRRAGRDLGDDPATRFHALVDEAVRVAQRADPDLVVHTIVGGMRVAAYLPTRTFELCVHGLDLAAATGAPIALPARAVEEAAALAAVSAAQRGLGPDLLLAMTGRRGLPPGFSVV
ncbi:maleylpyruvate isomerase N-terminal domain-containing protein [Nocardioides panacis]|uniref:Maleylpyruvate isomerase N-terminal domain-containing protein n=1 Tax=Nocardioides panacis TaxID=2849501 RepID=A0A975SWX2_9ACTN|nr:maleylpyruvate isomerase N-terminal domain-containing protein [Nocardioides panacis]QWZ07302.1 maleylpyruvate isomerase N-terminal domain-containing protein [Nocardioides panacis]